MTGRAVTFHGPAIAAPFRPESPTIFREPGSPPAVAAIQKTGAERGFSDRFHAAAFLLPCGAGYV